MTEIKDCLEFDPGVVHETLGKTEALMTLARTKMPFGKYAGLTLESGTHRTKKNMKTIFQDDFWQDMGIRFSRNMREEAICIGSVPRFVVVRTYV